MNDSFWQNVKHRNSGKSKGRLGTVEYRNDSLTYRKPGCTTYNRVTGYLFQQHISVTIDKTRWNYIKKYNVHSGIFF